MNGQSQTYQNFEPRWGLALVLGLAAAAGWYQSALTVKLAQGYTTGRFVSGKAAKSIKIRRPQMGPDGPEASVYTNDFKQRMWEFGSFNAFTRRYERTPHWQETLDEQRQGMARAFAQAFNGALRA